MKVNVLVMLICVLNTTNTVIIYSDDRIDKDAILHLTECVQSASDYNTTEDFKFIVNFWYFLNKLNFSQRVFSFDRVHNIQNCVRNSEEIYQKRINEAFYNSINQSNENQQKLANSSCCSYGLFVFTIFNWLLFSWLSLFLIIF